MFMFVFVRRIPPYWSDADRVSKPVPDSATPSAFSPSPAFVIDPPDEPPTGVSAPLQDDVARGALTNSLSPSHPAGGLPTRVLRHRQPHRPFPQPEPGTVDGRG